MEKSQKIILSVLAVVFVGITITCFVFSKYGGKEQISPTFVAPAFDDNAVILSSEEIPQSAQYKSLSIKSDFEISMASVVAINDNVADVYFTSKTTNTAWLKIEVLSSDGKIFYGESGLLNAGETIKQIKLNSNPPGEELIIKILSYEPDTYYSMGTATVRVTIAK